MAEKASKRRKSKKAPPKNGQKAGLSAPGVADLQAAAEQAIKAYQYEDAISLFNQALEAAQREGTSLEPLDEYELLSGRALCYSRLGLLKEEGDDLFRMIDLAKSLRGPDPIRRCPV